MSLCSVAPYMESRAPRKQVYPVRDDAWLLEWLPYLLLEPLLCVKLRYLPTRLDVTSRHHISFKKVLIGTPDRNAPVILNESPLAQYISLLLQSL